MLRRVTNNAAGGLCGSIDVRRTRLPIADRDAHATLSAPRRATKERFARRHDTLDRFIGAAIVILFAAVRRLDQRSSWPRNEFGPARGARAVSAVF